jgi:hypothetical protein
MKKFFIPALVTLMLLPVFLRAQKIIKVPNFAVSTHPFFINEVSYRKNAFVITLTIENKSPSGYFCVSKNIYLQNILTREKLYMTRSEGIPVCPDVYHFKWQGEKLTFKLWFPRLDTNIRYIDVVENCNEHCFSIFGLILDQKMNDDINKGYDAYEHGDFEQAYLDFKNAIKQNPGYPYGFLYANIIKTLMAQNKTAEAKVWYKSLQQSRLLDKEAILDQISKESYFDRLK